jgi:hypothetical protein
MPGMERGAGQPRLVWNRSSTQWWFPYAEPSLAVEIAREKVYLVTSDRIRRTVTGCS